MAELRRRAKEATTPPSFARALRQAKVAVIAEVKRSSPSKGVINSALDVEQQARAYDAGGAAAISILTESNRFGGSNEDLVKAAAIIRLPLLKKDFHVDVSQIYEAKALGAAAALVIVRAVNPDRLRELIEAGHEVGVDLLVEVRDEAELRLALSLGAEIIGVNNRNLETLEIDTTTAKRVIPHVPKGVIAVAESGVKTVKDVKRLAGAGADAVLVGSELSASLDPESSVRSLTGIKRNGNARKG